MHNNNTTDTQSAKRMKSEMDAHAFNSSTSKQQIIRNKVTIPSIEKVLGIWLGFSIYKAMALHRGIELIRQTRTNEVFAKIGTPSREILDFRTLWRVFFHVPQIYYQNERPDAVPWHHLHFTQNSESRKDRPNHRPLWRFPHHHPFRPRIQGY